MKFLSFWGELSQAEQSEQSGNPGPPGPSFQSPCGMCTLIHTQMPQHPGAEPASPGQEPLSPCRLGQHCPLGGEPRGPGSQIIGCRDKHQGGVVCAGSLRAHPQLLSFSSSPPTPTPCCPPPAAPPRCPAPARAVCWLPVTEWGQLLRQTAPRREVGTLLTGGDTNVTRFAWKRQPSPPASCQ